MRKEKYTSMLLTKREDISHLDLINFRLYWIGFYICFSNELKELNDLNALNDLNDLTDLTDKFLLLAALFIFWK